MRMYSKLTFALNLDLFVLAEYADLMVIGSGSTYSGLIAALNAGKPGVELTMEYQSSSCKDRYFAGFPACCATRRRWADVYVRQGVLQPHEPCDVEV
jgi:hypothetical protein